MTRDYIAEALAIAEGRTKLRAEWSHLDGLLSFIASIMTDEEWEKFRSEHPYPQPEPDAEFERMTRG